MLQSQPTSCVQTWSVGQAQMQSKEQGRLCSGLHSRAWGVWPQLPLLALNANLDTTSPALLTVFELELPMEELEGLKTPFWQV